MRDAPWEKCAGGDQGQRAPPHDPLLLSICLKLHHSFLVYIHSLASLQFTLLYNWSNKREDKKNPCLSYTPKATIFPHTPIYRLNQPLAPFLRVRNNKDSITTHPSLTLSDLKCRGLDWTICTVPSSH